MGENVTFDTATRRNKKKNDGKKKTCKAESSVWERLNLLIKVKGEYTTLRTDRDSGKKGAKVAMEGEERGDVHLPTGEKKKKDNPSKGSREKKRRGEEKNQGGKGKSFLQGTPPKKASMISLSSAPATKGKKARQRRQKV